MLRAIQPGSTFDFVPKECADMEETDPNRVTFQVKHLSVDELAEVEDAVGAYDADDGTMRMKVGTQILTALRVGLRGWRNFKFENADGEVTDAEFKTKEISIKKKGRASRDDRNRTETIPTDETLGLIPSTVRTQIANAITEGNKVSEKQKGNSE